MQLNEKITKIDVETFKNCFNLQKVTGFNDNIDIKSMAFSNCLYLKPEDFTEITKLDSDAFLKTDDYWLKMDFIYYSMLNKNLNSLFLLFIFNKSFSIWCRY